MTAKLTQEKSLYLDVFTRNFCFCFSNIYISVLFFTEVGKENWPQVSQLTQIFAMVFVVLAFFLRKKIFFRIHLVLTAFFIIALMLFSFNPSSTLLIIVLAAQNFSLDLIGDISSSNAMMYLFTPLQYKRMSPKIVSANISASIAASISVIAVQRWGSPQIFTGILVSMSFFHLYLYRFLYTRALVAYAKTKENILIEKGLTAIKKTVKYAFKNQLLILTFILMIWSQIAKFFNDWLYLSSASDIFDDKEKLSTFLSISHLTLMVVVAIFQRTFSKSLLNRFAPATLLSLSPLLFLVIAPMAYITESTYFGIVLYYFFWLIQKTLQIPTLKISMQSLDQNMRPTVYLFLNFSISLILLFVTTFMSQLKSYFSYNLLYGCLIIMGIVALVISTQFDSKYLKNVWQTIKKRNIEDNLNDNYVQNPAIDYQKPFHYFNPHHFFIAPYDKAIDPYVLEYIQSLQLFKGSVLPIEFKEHFEDEKRTAFEKLLLIINTYIFAKNFELFEVAVKAHKKLLESSYKEEVEKAIQLMNLIDTPEFTEELKKMATSDILEKKEFALKALGRKNRLINSRFEYSKAHNLLVIFGKLNWDFLAEDLREKLCNLLERPYTKQLDGLAQLLSIQSLITSKELLLRCFDIETMKFNHIKLVEAYLAAPNEQKIELQSAMRRIHPTSISRSVIKEKLQMIFDQKDLDKHSRSENLSLLFLIEWTYIDREDYNFLLQSFENYSDLTDDDQIAWYDFHQEFLKKTDFKQYSSHLLS